MKHYRIYITILVTLLLLTSTVSCSQLKATPTATAIPPTIPPTMILPTSTPSFVEPVYGEPGKFSIQSENFTLQNGNEAVEAVVYYPTMDGVPNTANGPFPLVIWSQGLSTFKAWFSTQLNAIATYGFVVITWTPRGELGTEFWAGAATRLLDLQLIINYADKMTAPGGQWAGLINTDRIAVTGISSGGWTALMGGGARMDLGWCLANPDIVKNKLNALSNCPQFVPHQQEIAAMLGLASAPSGLWPAINDPRVAAVIAVSPDGDIWGADYEGVAAMQVPTLIMAGEIDYLSPPEYGAIPIYEHLGSANKALVMYKYGDHTLGWHTTEKYNKQIQHLMVAFLLAELNSDPAAFKALSPENVFFEDVTYQTTGFNP